MFLSFLLVLRFLMFIQFSFNFISVKVILLHQVKTEHGFSYEYVSLKVIYIFTSTHRIIHGCFKAFQWTFKCLFKIWFQVMFILFHFMVFVKCNNPDKQDIPSKILLRLWFHAVCNPIKCIDESKFAPNVIRKQVQLTFTKKGVWNTANDLCW